MHAELRFLLLLLVLRRVGAKICRSSSGEHIACIVEEESGGKYKISSKGKAGTLKYAKLKEIRTRAPNECQSLARCLSTEGREVRVRPPKTGATYQQNVQHRGKLQCRR